MPELDFQWFSKVTRHKENKYLLFGYNRLLQSKLRGDQYMYCGEHNFWNTLYVICMCIVHM